MYKCLICNCTHTIFSHSFTHLTYNLLLFDSLTVNQTSINTVSKSPNCLLISGLINFTKLYNQVDGKLKLCSNMGHILSGTIYLFATLMKKLLILCYLAIASSTYCYEYIYFYSFNNG